MCPYGPLMPTAGGSDILTRSLKSTGKEASEIAHWRLLELLFEESSHATFYWLVCKTRRFHAR